MNWRKGPKWLRHRDRVAGADPRSLWELGCDAHRFSSSRSPGEMLQAAAAQRIINILDGAAPESAI